MGKGDTPRKVDKKKFDDEYDRIFGAKEPEEFQKGRKIRPKGQQWADHNGVWKYT